jgi:hypothetical protein
MFVFHVLLAQTSCLFGHERVQFSPVGRLPFVVLTWCVLKCAPRFLCLLPASGGVLNLAMPCQVKGAFFGSACEGIPPECVSCRSRAAWSFCSRVRSAVLRRYIAASAAAFACVCAWRVGLVTLLPVGGGSVTGGNLFFTSHPPVGGRCFH